MSSNQEYKILSEDLDAILFIAKFEEGLDASDPIQLHEFVLKRKKRIIRRIDRKKSRAAKASWKSNKKERVKTLKKWHRSTSGKQFHKQLSRFNSSRLKRESNEYTSRDMIALSSIKTNLYIFSEYIEPFIEDQAHKDMFISEAIESIDIMSMCIESNTELSEEMILNVMQLLNPIAVNSIFETDKQKYASAISACKLIYPTI